jgi:hypothetical protein
MNEPLKNFGSSKSLITNLRLTGEPEEIVVVRALKSAFAADRANLTTSG